jgi:DNA-binding NtrC family response regulator
MAKVLVVDDVDTYRRYLALELRAQGHEVELAENPRKAIAVGSESPPDVLVVDWMLNDELNGLDVAEAIRCVNPSVQTILITGHPSADLRRVAMEQRLWFMKKPFSLVDIAIAVDKAARMSHPSR